ncbi:MAG: hypothetical protein O3A51_08310, partial [Verrucomicrobia bacterium]|nr:hypothetical protein [Verrucomicrobiota bacterium]
TTTYDYNNSGVYLNLYNGVMEDCIFSGNITTGASGQSGGALYLYHSDTTFRRVIMVGNNTLYGGGAVGVEGLSETRFENVLIAGNKSRYFGGGIYFNNISGLETDFINCTITDNRTTEANASYGGGGITMYNGDLNVTNTIVYGNTSAGAGQQVRLQNTGDIGTFGYSDLEGGAAAVHEVAGAMAVDEAGNIDDDPLFETGDSGAWTATGSYDPMTGETVLTDAGAAFVPGALVGWYVNPDTTDNFVYYISANSATTITIWGDASGVLAADAYEVRSYRLSDISPCVDSGSEDGAPATDIVGFARPFATGIDMGAYESTAGFLGTVFEFK